MSGSNDSLNTRKRPWLFCGAVGLSGVLLSLTGIGLLVTQTEDVPWLLGVALIAVGALFGAIAADHWMWERGREPAATIADLERTREALRADLQKDFGALGLDQTREAIAKLQEALGTAIPKLPDPATQQVAVENFRKMLTTTGSTLGTNLAQMSGEIGAVLAHVGALRGVVETEVKFLKSEIKEANTASREELMRRLDRMEKVLEALQPLADRQVVDPELTKGVVDRITKFDGLADDVRELVNRLKEDLGAAGDTRQGVLPSSPNERPRRW